MNASTTTEAAAIESSGADVDSSTGREPIGSATYSPDDNKLRIYPLHRLSASDYATVKAAGYAWAPKQDLFVAPMWTPERAAVAIELCGEIGDEDTSLCDRAEERAERFEGYSDKRGAEAASARAGVARITEGIPMGQPILIGHHSERHARKDAERIENGMRKAVQLWETSTYWIRRAAGALRAAKYKELPAVRARRIKGIEADQRKAQKNRDESAAMLRAWSTVHDAEASTIRRKDGTPTTFAERASYLADRCYLSHSFTLAEYPRALPASQYEGTMSIGSALSGNVCTPEQAQALAVRMLTRTIANCDAWLMHYGNRLAYERAMLDEAGGLVAERFDLQPGGIITYRGGRRGAILRVNRRDGRALSVTVTGRDYGAVSIEEITAYDAPTEETAAAVAAVVKKPPLCNYPGEGFIHITQAQWDACGSDYKSTTKQPKAEGLQPHRARVMLGVFAGVKGDDMNKTHGYPFVYITDAKRTDPPKIGEQPKAPRKRMARQIAEAAGVDTSGQADEPATPAPGLAEAKAEARTVLADATAPSVAETQAQILARQRAREEREAREAEGADFAAMREALRTGQAVQVVSAPQLFPTPADVAARMVALADVQAGECVLEPSAGTGAIVRAVLDAADTEVMAYEINQQLCAKLGATFPAHQLQARCRDFLDVTAFQGCYPVVLMNPPFKDGADVKHIQHARTFLAPGGRLVAICAAGPRQHAELQPLADSWEYLEPGTFAGTNVRAVLLTMRAPQGPHPEIQNPAAPAGIANESPAEAGATIDGGKVSDDDTPAAAAPAQVAAIVETCMRRRLEWAQGQFPPAAEIEREARGLDDCCAQPDFTGPTAAAYRAAAVQLRAIAAAGPGSDEARAVLAAICK